MIDKSIRQYYQNGERVDPYKKGLEIIAGEGKDTFQTTAPDKITAKSLIQPTEKMTFPSVKASGKIPPIRTLPTITPPSLDSARYSGLINILPKKEGSYLDKYINKDPVRIVEAKPTVENTAAMENVGIGSDYLTSSLVGTNKATLQDTFPGIDIANTLDVLSTKGEAGDTAYSDTQIENIIKNANPNEKNLITTIFKTANDTINDTINNLGLDTTQIATNLVTKKVGDIVATKLGFSGGAAGGPIGMLIGWLVGKAVEKFTGGKKDEMPKGAISLADKDSTDKEFKVSGTYGGNEVYSSDGSSVDSKTGDITNADGSHGGNIVDEFPSEPAKPTVTYTPPVHHHTGGADNRNDPGGGRGQSPTGRDVAGTPFLKGGRVDKALGGRSRDI